jgi:hypothetical protein
LKNLQKRPAFAGVFADLRPKNSCPADNFSAKREARHGGCRRLGDASKSAPIQALQRWKTRCEIMKFGRMRDII